MRLILTRKHFFFPVRIALSGKTVPITRLPEGMSQLQHHGMGAILNLKHGSLALHATLEAAWKAHQHLKEST